MMDAATRVAEDRRLADEAYREARQAGHDLAYLVGTLKASVRIGTPMEEIQEMLDRITPLHIEAETKAARAAEHRTRAVMREVWEL